MSVCAVAGCDSRYSASSKNTVSLHRLPVNSDKMKKWLDSLEGNLKKRPNKVIAVCSLHFEPDMVVKAPMKLAKLKDCAIPTIFPVKKVQKRPRRNKLERLYPALTSAKKQDSDPDKMCIVCLDVNVKLWILKRELKENYMDLTGLYVRPSNGVRYICWECVGRLNSAVAFKEKAIRAEELLAAKGSKAIFKEDREKYKLTSRLSVKSIFTYAVTDEGVFEDDIKTEVIKEERIEDRELDVNVLPEGLDQLSEKSNEDDSEWKIDVKESETKDVFKTNESHSKNAIVKRKKIDRRKTMQLDMFPDVIELKKLTREEQIEEFSTQKYSARYKSSLHKCNVCYKIMSSSEQLKYHMIRHLDSYGNHFCSICKLYFKKKSRYDVHERAHMYRYCCKKCDFVTKYRICVKSHVNFHGGKTFVCPHCPSVYYIYTSYMGHLRVKHPSNTACVYCGLSFVNDTGLHFHVKRMHPSSVEQTECRGPVCEPCGIQFMSQEAYETHLSVSPKHPEKHRSNSVKSSYYPRLHLKSNQWKPVQCEVCNETLSHPVALYSHFRWKHPDKNRTNYTSPNLCEVCGRVFGSPKILLDHMTLHDSSAQFPCVICNKVFKQKSLLRQHGQVHSAERRLFSCNRCDKSYTFKGNLKRHMMLHMVEKPYKCDICGKQFTSSNGKKSHMDCVHNKQPWPKRDRSKRAKKQVEKDQQPAQATFTTIEDQVIYNFNTLQSE